ncbi:MAG: HAMP domain-containing histidine kinase [Labilithrix sp.]|nr:HAMP domain-containing histidine kinase [Labilithrix sp.]
MTAERANDAPFTVGIVGEAPPGVYEHVLAAVVATGASADVWTEASALSKRAAVDAVVFLVGGAPRRLHPIASALDRDPRTRGVPRVHVVDAAATAAELAPLGPGMLVLASARREVFMTAFSRVAEQIRANADAARRARSESAELGELERMLADIQGEGASLSHDARVLFGVILGYASNMRDGFAGPITDEQRRHVLNIVEASHDAAALLDRYVAALRRVVPATSEPPRSLVPRVDVRREHDVGELARGTVALFGGVAAAKGIRLRAETIGVRAWCDAMQIKQALVNLIANALKLTPAGGSVDVVERISASPLVAARREVELVVVDTGPGIPPEHRARVFERGVRLERDRDTPGSGVGLTIVRDVAEMHHGRVRVDETPGGGASIALVFPVNLRTRSGESRAVSPPTSADGAPDDPASPRSSPPSSPRRRELRDFE